MILNEFFNLPQVFEKDMNEFDASGYDRYSIYMDDYDLEEKFSDLDDAVDAIEAYKRDDPKSRYADYNVRDLDGKVVWRNDAWQDIQKPGKIQFLPRNDQGVAEGSKPGEYYVHTVYFKDGTKKRIRVTSDEVDVADYYTKRGQAVDRVDYDFQLHSDMTESEKEPTTRQELLDRVDKIQRMMTQERNPANLQILRKELEMLKQRYQHLREDSDGGEAVEMAIMRRMLVAHTDLIVEFGLDKVVQAIEEVAYNVGDTDEIGSSDVSGWVHQVKQILGADA